MSKKTSKPRQAPLPQPKLERQARLRIIPAEPGKRAQDCGACRIQGNCWMANIKEEHIITNLLVCRIKRGIDLNRSAKLFLEMVRPKLKVFAKQAIRDTSIPMDIALADLESETIDYLQHHYIMGEIAYPLHRLFSPQNGHITFYANNYARKTRKYEETHVLEDDRENRYDLASENAYVQLDDETDETEMTRRARGILDDGITLTLAEYRVLKFCLSNAIEAKRPLNGLHVYLARTMGLTRAKITKMYSDATKKMVAEARSR